MKDHSWYEDWFGQQLSFARYNLLGMPVDAFKYLTLFEHAGALYLGNNYERFGLAELCADTVDALRDEFVGSIGWADPHAGYSNSHLEDVDFVVVRMWTQEHFRTDTFANYLAPAVGEIRTAARTHLNELKPYLPDDLPIYIHLLAMAADGQGGFTGEPAQTSPPDYQEQAYYYEAFFEEIEATDWIDGVFIWNIDWQDWTPPTGRESVTAMNFASIRGRPAEEVIRLWFGLWSGEER